MNDPLLSRFLIMKIGAVANEDTSIYMASDGGLAARSRLGDFLV